MPPPDDHIPAPPDLPSYTVEDVVETTPQETRRHREAREPIERHAGTGLVRHSVVLDEERIDPDAAKVVRRLERSGYEAYLVGGCVRDLLLGGKPKDFDIATSARPEDVRALFRNCRVIGRRFRLAHILFGGGKVIEVATFRRNPAMEAPEEESSEVFDDLLIRSDNVFGEAHEDALRRDFTMNALFYDLDRRQVLDWCGGMQDVRRRHDPHDRRADHPLSRRPDPHPAGGQVRGPPRSRASRRTCTTRWSRPGKTSRRRPDRASSRRSCACFAEAPRIDRCGSSGRRARCPSCCRSSRRSSTTRRPREGGAGRFFRTMDAIDAMTRARGRALDDIALWTLLLKEPLDEACAGERDKIHAASEFLDPVIERVAVPRRIADGVRRIIAILPRLAAGKAGRFARTDLIIPALDVLEAELLATGRSTEAVQKMRAGHVVVAGRPSSSRSAPPRRDVRGPRQRRGAE